MENEWIALGGNSKEEMIKNNFLKKKIYDGIIYIWYSTRNTVYVFILIIYWDNKR